MGRWTEADLRTIRRRRVTGAEAEAAFSAEIDPLAIATGGKVGELCYPLVLLCRQAKLPEPVPEYEFHPERHWRFDYAFPYKKIAVEIDGGLWLRAKGAHSRPENIKRDMEKINAAIMLGWRVLRFTPQELGAAIEHLRILLR